MKIEFVKMHGAGNDYVYVDCTEKELPNMEAVSEYVSHRRFSIGSDGLICICRSDIADFKMRMFNADRSEGKMCGNGVRCVAKFVYDNGLTDKTKITLETLAGVKEIEMTVADGKVVSAKVDMGKPVFKCAEIPMISDHFMFVDQGLVLSDNYGEEKVVYNGTSISMGNPHFVTFVKDVDSLDLEKLGPQFEHHKLFPEGVNTEFVEIIDKNTVKFRVWERGSGETWACGTGASAVAVACVLLNNAGKKGEPLTVIAKGGTLKVTYEKNDHVTLEGGAEEAFRGTVEIPDELLK
ncbi:MAG: diaminopimelate epimerase [Acidaminococcaceae bacterium]|nr:diaminopimelate epimerase [Acidaminococcaceae bacterium]